MVSRNLGHGLGDPCPSGPVGVHLPPIRVRVRSCRANSRIFVVRFSAPVMPSAGRGFFIRHAKGDTPGTPLMTPSPLPRSTKSRTASRRSSGSSPATFFTCGIQMSLRECARGDSSSFYCLLSTALLLSRSAGLSSKSHVPAEVRRGTLQLREVKRNATPQ